MLNISTFLGNTAIEQFKKDKVAYPYKLRHTLFTVAAIDNVYVKPTSATAMSSFHATAVSLHQKVSMNYAGGLRDVQITLSKKKVLRKFSNEYCRFSHAGNWELVKLIVRTNFRRSHVCLHSQAGNWP